ncbi:pantoate--beta-alanine ligase [Telmatospirillum siberiense]|uniref:Pantothenate synthetase n=1 Tax=Telmatospirillum siberiense TaxID=382514 RepID=A0A2N3Q0Q9_9PROT|nr:pantoate--beta-alanine ligase [Telmatospirillum siberiense]
MTIQNTLPTFRTVALLRDTIRAWQGQGLRVALIPTMGALHAGHMALVTRALQVADRAVASVFVNPTQFGPKEDFASYPRRESEDAMLLMKNGGHGLYAPTVDEMYPEGFVTSITVGGPSAGLCGDFRPGHFSGVATVVTKLLLQSGADVALFGEKDYQQLQVIRRLVRDLNIPTVIEGVPTVRESDGLAMSSRNAYLSVEERAIAPILHQTLMAMASRVAERAPIAEQEAWGRKQLLTAGFRAVDYLSVRDAESLTPLDTLTGAARILAAAHLGKTRLIDNVGVRPA